MSLHIYIDADACPVREETYKVARRHNVPVTVVSNSFLRTLRPLPIKTAQNFLSACM